MMCFQDISLWILVEKMVDLWLANHLSLQFSTDIVCFDQSSIHTSSDFCSGEKISLANVGVEPTTFALLARRSNQLS